MRQKSTIILTVATILLAITTGVLYYNRQTQLQEQAERLQLQQENELEKSRMKLTAEVHPVNIADGLISHTDGQGVLLLDPETFQENASRKPGQSDGFSRIGCYLQEQIAAEDLLILEFQAQTSGKYVDLTVQCGSVANVVTVGPVPSQYYIPVTGQKSVESISFMQEYIKDGFDPVVLGDVRMVNYGSQQEPARLRTGQYELGSFQTVSIDADKAVLDKADKLLVSGDFLYHLKAGTLRIYHKGTYELVSYVSGLGETRDMCFTKDAKALVVVSRSSGVYIVSVADILNSRILSHYDSLELCTGVDVDGDYAYIASRFFGVEIVDLRDLEKPAYVNRIQPEQEAEYQDCLVQDGLLYVGVYAQQRVDVYDLRDFADIRLLSTLNLDGCGQGLAVKENVLFVTTGLYQGDDHSGPVTTYGKGAGNGLEIYDMSDPSSPKRLSKVKLDGRLFSYSGIDEWDVILSGNKALICGMGCGLYVYDVSDPARPVRETVYQVTAKPASAKYTKSYGIDQTFPAVYPYNTDLERRGWVTGVAVDKGSAYLVTYDMGIYPLTGEWLVPAETKPVWKPVSVLVPDLEVPQLEGYRISRLQSEGSVWAVCEVSDSVMAVAAGEAGILLITRDLQIVSQLDTRYSVKDIRYQNGYLYTAESEGGLGIYTIDENSTLVPVGRFADNGYNSCYSSLAITPDDAFVIVQTFLSRYVIVNVSDKTMPVSVPIPTQDPIGNLYYRTLSTGLIGGKYIGITGLSGIHWYYSENGQIRYLKDTSGRVGYDNQGMAASGENCIMISSNGYRYWNPEKGNVSQNHVMSQEYFNGKAVTRGNTLAVSRNYDGRFCLVDISNIDSPRMTMVLDLGCPIDVACMSEDAIWLPCRNDGLLKLEKTA